MDTAWTQNPELTRTSRKWPILASSNGRGGHGSLAYGLVIGEGVETVLAAATRIEYSGTSLRPTLLRPAWAAGSKNNLASFPVLNGIDALTVLVDHDANGEGQKAASQCIWRWRRAGREAFGLIPQQVDADFNDLVRRRAS